MLICLWFALNFVCTLIMNEIYEIRAAFSKKKKEYKTCKNRNNNCIKERQRIRNKSIFHYSCVQKKPYLLLYLKQSFLFLL